jgi:hypothetical protein
LSRDSGLSRHLNTKSFEVRREEDLESSWDEFCGKQPLIVDLACSVEKRRVAHPGEQHRVYGVRRLDTYAVFRRPSIVPCREECILAGEVFSTVLRERGDVVRTIDCCPIISDLSGRASLSERANHQLLISGVSAARLCVHLCLLQPDSPSSLSTRPEAAEPPVESIDLGVSSDLHRYHSNHQTDTTSVSLKS